MILLVLCGGAAFAVAETTRRRAPALAAIGAACALAYIWIIASGP